MNDTAPSTVPPTEHQPSLPYAPLNHLGVLRVQGNDAPSFLHGQLSNDILTLMPGHARLAGYLTPNGRLIATLWVIRHDPVPEDKQKTDSSPTFWLVCARDVAATVARRLAMYVLRAKCKVHDLSNDHHVLGYIGPARHATQALQEAGVRDVISAALPTVALTQTTADMLTTPVRRLLGSERILARSMLILSATQLSSLVTPANPTTPSAIAASENSSAESATSIDIPQSPSSPAGPETSPDPNVLPGGGQAAQDMDRQTSPQGIRFKMSASDWLQLDVSSGIPWIYAATAETFIPQMLNLELVGGVSFKKGCYPGQEVVARSEYRGKVKRRMFAGMCSGPLPPPGTDVLAWDASPIGKVISVASLSLDTDEEVMAGHDIVMDPEQEELPIVLVGRRFLLLFEARIDSVGAQPRSAGMIATSLRIGNAAIGLLRLPYDIPEN